METVKEFAGLTVMTLVFTPPSHFVRVKLPNGEKADNQNRISKT